LIQPVARPTDPETTERVRAICTSLPGVTERLSHGEAAWFVGPRQFVTTSDHHHDDRLGLWCAAPQGAQEALVQAAPNRFFRPPYVGHRGWLGVRLDGRVDWGEVAELCEDAYRTVAPARLVARLDDSDRDADGGTGRG
jgi:hypothetical protein